MTSILIQYLVGLTLIGYSLDDIRHHALKFTFGILLVVAAILHFSLLSL